jgi:hypothetical protein
MTYVNDEHNVLDETDVLNVTDVTDDDDATYAIVMCLMPLMGLISFV